MRGYAFGCEDAGVICPEQVSHQGVEIGRVLRADARMARLALTKELHDGDGLQFRADREIGEMIYAGPETPAGSEALVRLREGLKVKAGDRVMRLTDAVQMRRADALPGRTVPAEMTLRAMPGEPLCLRVTDGENEVTVTGETVSPARTREAREEELVRGLSRTGETVFVPVKVKAETRGAFVAASQVNGLRREALEKLAEARADRFAPARGREGKMPSCTLPERLLPPMAEARTEEQAEKAREAGFRVIRYPEDYREENLRALLEAMAPGDWLRLPDVCEEKTLENLRALTEEYRDRLGGVVLGSVGQLGQSWPVPFGTSGSVPVMNRQAAALLFEAGCDFVTASEELTGQELRILTEGGAPIAVKVWGRTQLMLLHHCPARTAMGLQSGHAACTLCDRGADEALRGQCLEDPRGYRYPLLRLRLPEGCLVRLMNALPTDWMDRPGLRSPLVSLTAEDGEETEEILAAWKEGRKAKSPSTLGHWKRPIE